MVVIGLENVLVLTKSVVSTPVDLEVKLRIAQGNTAGSEGGAGGGGCFCAALPAVEETGGPTGRPCSDLQYNVVWTAGPWGLGSMCPEEPRNC